VTAARSATTPTGAPSSTFWFADVVVLNKASDVSEAVRAEIRATIAGLNPDARLIEADYGRVPLAAILDTGLFDEQKAATHPLWHKELYSPESHMPETEEYGIGSFVYRARRPLDPEKFLAFVHRSWPGLVRAKGHFWLATRPEWIGLYSVAGIQTRCEPKGYWWATVPATHWPTYQEFRDLLAKHWDKRWGDRRQELVFIGVGLDEVAIRTALDDCLVGTEDGFDPILAKSLKDPFPAWQAPQAA
jgi:G3E family GTPase